MTKESNTPGEFPIFKDIDLITFLAWRCDFITRIELLAKRLPYVCKVNYNVNHISLILDMLQRRRVYFWVFHCLALGELNEACLICFWILKLNPFFDPNNPHRNLNLDLALNVFLDGIRYTVSKNNEKFKQKLAANFDDNIVEHLKHAFAVRDISKEAIMALAESLIYKTPYATL